MTLSSGGQYLTLATGSSLLHVQAIGARQRLFRSAHAKPLRLVANKRRRDLYHRGAGQPQPLKRPDTGEGAGGGFPTWLIRELPRLAQNL